MEHKVDVIESKGHSLWRTSYWWACLDCEDEAGPFEMWEQAHDSAIAHGKVI